MKTEFSEKDVKIVAKALVDHSVHCVDYIEDRFTYYQCIYCHEEDFFPERVKHDMNCPVLVARDLLTRT